MLGKVIAYIGDQLNSYIARKQGYGPGTNKVVISPIFNQDGSLAITTDNVIVMTMVDLRKDGSAYSYNAGAYPGYGGAIDFSAIHLNVYLLFSGYFKAKNTVDALNFLSFVLEFFQQHPQMDRDSFPTLPASVQKLDFHFESQDFVQKSYMWNLIGAKYMPSVLYKMQLIAVSDPSTTATAPQIITVEDEVSPL
ncbi:MAG: DUF4255 domain-containing protein [Bacteroidota bacterium]